MADRKYKPALYELLERGPLMRDKQGSTGMSRWFNRRKKTAGDLKPATGSDKLHRPTGFSLSVPETQTENPNDEPRRVEFSVTRKTLLLVGFGMTLAFLVVFMLGQASVKPSPQGEKNQQQQASLSTGLDSLRDVPVRPDIYPDKSTILKSTGTRQENTVKDSPLVKPVTSGPKAKNPEQAAKPPVEGNKRLLLCNFREPGTLLPVQDHFTRYGMRTEIVKIQGSSKFWLVSKQSFDRLSELGGQHLKQRAFKIGSAYNDVKPKTALGFRADTFASAYPVRIGEIEQVYSR